MAQTKREASLNFRLDPEIKRTIEQAAAQLGQSVSDFAVSSLVQVARDVIERENVTKLTERDQREFSRMLDEVKTTPNKALMSAVRKYKRQIQ